MSLPIPSSSGKPLDAKQLQALDAPLIALTQQCGGDLRRLMFAYFSFLHRRTDFYLVPHEDDTSSKMGFKEGDAEKLLLAAFRQFPLRKIPKGGPKAAAPPPPKAAKKAPPAAANEKETTTTETKVSPAKKDTPTTEAATKSKTEEKEQVGNMIGVTYNEEGLQNPVGNGGSTPRYKWTQTIDECSVLVGVPKDFRGRDLDIRMTASTLTVKSKKPLPGEEKPRTFMEGKLVEKIRVDESTWSVEGGVVIVTLDKVKKTFWATILEGDEKIDTEAVDSRRHISEYDGATQGHIRKVIFDQTQYHLGGPTSDEILGTKPKVPPLPTGVEYIDKQKLDDEEAKTKAAAKKAKEDSS